MEVRLVHQSDSLDVFFDAENGWLYADWKGRHHDASIKEGINLLIDLMDKYQVFKVLNDNTHMTGIWTGVAGWLVLDALPRARKTGLQAFAHVFGASSFSRVSAEAALMLLKPSDVDIKTFEDIESAKEWLRNCFPGRPRSN